MKKFPFCFWVKYGHWCKATPMIALDHLLKGGKIKIGKK
jgi:3-oxoacyl-[acyl-carrier-protein] synthase III